MNDHIKVTPDFAYRVFQARQRRDGFVGMRKSTMVEKTKQFAIGLTAVRFKETLDLIEEADALSKKVTALREQFQVLHTKAKRTDDEKEANRFYKEASELFLEAQTATNRLKEIEMSLA